VEPRRLGSAGPLVSPIGLGAMGFSGLYGPTDDAESVATIHAAIDAGVNLIDTADFYGAGHNETLIARALRERRREDAIISVKFGGLRDPAGAFTGSDGRPLAMKNYLAYTLARLGTDHVDIYRLTRVDPEVPIEETIGAIAEMVEAGYVRHIGLSEAGAATIRRAAAVHPISDLQIEYSLFSRAVETEILPTLRELGIGMTAYGVLSRGLLSDDRRADQEFAAGDFRRFSPRFQPGNIERNLELTTALTDVAAGLGVTTAQLAVAWVASRGDDIVPLVGARHRGQLDDVLGAARLELGPADLELIERAVPAGAAAGPRYPEAQMAALDSER
jgi:aryl-alcohol dehydrogenase-like predicted oxidoreductase